MKVGYMVSEEECLAIGGHCWHEWKNSIVLTKDCIHCGRTEILGTNGWKNIHD